MTITVEDEKLKISTPVPDSVEIFTKQQLIDWKYYLNKDIDDKNAAIASIQQKIAYVDGLLEQCDILGVVK